MNHTAGKRRKIPLVACWNASKWGEGDKRKRKPLGGGSGKETTSLNHPEEITEGPNPDYSKRKQKSKKDLTRQVGEQAEETGCSKRSPRPEGV